MFYSNSKFFRLKLMTFDQTDQVFDTTVLIDDFKVMSEARETHSNPNYIKTSYGYQYTGDIALVSLLPDVKGLYPANTNQIVLTFIVRNEGPEVAGDVTISFTPPFGTFVFFLLLLFYFCFWIEINVWEMKK